ncbi:MAG: hypothetical protein A3J07_04975 [Candidatus Doudnabacteria bacterium RIFCSPLOWO2_02_FULL_49_13]|uniref:Uncharacterized protein n=1 Tax=Candidatus Doudnabacteria bacterium RIFCSPHIGHO2_12_FULL_48_16 TaxID=1817838 RepID=A0A1F5PLB8_9BACT|nr:MAG: hypothetical protein A3B77_04615 [Candidatus Doudnabacteria bacterium RIFCSPHIGHO2_02_FULL_49_24]OGE88171.1 MAG: hypothetical protein A2760_02265 [Candidatus Doudnabacteria bacterium RIFCSPHIGHO2_01_FULL_50_67]OGE90480.1 MAG: hypothetical protein A3E29_05045 [Candidatus Doudnabacteria bacterium RIFCSPHIGHO2_12_FULL_48_16]OGE96542.1 MAG: hypothetical protein A2990_03490 [Candidatus Doudnabacteria bacterium RIFCSPLOWO2_01_FULL_49_40]OGF02716.1 MAG: hypothetical protein A3J07_04975 [Candid
MDPKRKRLYIIIITLCVLATVGILLWGRSSTPTVQFESPDTGKPAQTSTSSQPARSINPEAVYPPPPVFPQNQTIDISVLTSSNFTRLQGFQAVQLDQKELGRDNPFKKY